VLFLTEHHAMKAYWGRRCIAPHSLTSALDAGEWSASRPGLFTNRERAPGTLWIGGWVGPRAVLDAVVKRRILSSRRETNPRTPIVQPIAQRYTDWAIVALLSPILITINHEIALASLLLYMKLSTEDVKLAVSQQELKFNFWSAGNDGGPFGSNHWIPPG
jgi:hypothetical protein